MDVVAQAFQRDATPDNRRINRAQAIAIGKTFEHPGFGAAHGQAAERTDAIAFQEFGEAIAPAEQRLPRKELRLRRQAGTAQGGPAVWWFDEQFCDAML